MKLLTIISMLILTSCSSLLYYPIREEMVDRNRMPIPPEDVWIRSRAFFADQQNNNGDNTKAIGPLLHAWHFRSPAKAAKCTLVFFHGNAENLSTHFYSLYWLLDKGFDYLIFDYRGYGKSEGEATPEGLVLDGMAAITWMMSKSPEQPIVIFAQSLGGAVALRSLSELQKLKMLQNNKDIRLAIIDSSFASFRSAGQHVLANHWLTWPFQWLAHLFLSDKWAPKGQISNVSSIPLIFVHGENDHIVDEELGRRLYSEAPEPKEFWHVEKGEHTSFLWGSQGLKWRDRLIERLEQNCSSKKTD